MKRKVLQDGFTVSTMSWINEPGSWEQNHLVKEGEEEGRGGSWRIEDSGTELILRPDSKKDFWRQTYYTPLLIKDDGPIFALPMLPTQACTMTVNLSLTPVKQFDQAGLIIYLDSEHWIKTGIEVVDGNPKLSCVVTNKFSDWSTQPWDAPAVAIRASQFGNGSYVVEAKLKDEGHREEVWSFIRVAHLNITENNKLIHLGVFGCCPEKQAGCEIRFTGFNILEGVTFDHQSV